jgi:hypothetical protein
MIRRSSAATVANIIRKALGEGHVVDIEGFGTFRPSAGGFEFLPETRPRVFVAYVQEDLEIVRRLCSELKRQGYQPWLDKECLMPGQNWPRSIERAIEVSDFFIACFSKRSVTKRGIFQSELRYALDCARRLPLDDVFVIPVRLDDCRPPESVVRWLHHVDLFPDWKRGVGQICRAIDSELARRRKLPLAS